MWWSAGRYGYHGDGYRYYNRGCSIAGIFLLVVIGGGILAFNYFESYEGIIFNKRKSHSYGRYGSRRNRYYLYVKSLSGKKRSKSVGYGTYSKAKVGFFVRKRRRSLRAEIYSPAEYAGLLENEGKELPGVVKKAMENHKVAEGAEARAKALLDVRRRALPVPRIRPKPAPPVKMPDIVEPEPAAEPELHEKARKIKEPKPSEVVPYKEPAKVPPVEPESTEPEKKPEKAMPKPEMVKVYWVTLVSDRVLMALKCEESGSSYKISLPRGIKYSMPKSQVVSIKEDEIKADDLNKEVRALQRRIKTAKRRKELKQILSGRR